MMKILMHVKLSFLLLLVTNIGHATTLGGFGDPPLSLNWISAMSGPPTEIGPEQPEGCIDLNEQNQLELHVRLETGDGNTANYPDMYIEYDFGGVMNGLIGPLTKWDFTEGDSTYIFDQVFTVDLDAYCPGPNNGQISFLITYSLLTRVDGGFEAYPIQDHPGLFPPTHFDVSAPPVYAEDKVLCCYQGPLRSEQVETISSTSASDFTISSAAPNPFQSSIDVNCEVGENTDFLLQVFDLSGNVVFSNNYAYAKKGLQNIRLRLEEVPAGFYFLQIKNAHKTEVVKIIKTNTME